MSVDGSLLALAHGTVVTLWETSSNILMKVFDTADIEGVRKVQFLGSEGRWLAFAGQTRGVGVWDLLSCEGMSVFCVAVLIEADHLQSRMDTPLLPPTRGHFAIYSLSAILPRVDPHLWSIPASADHNLLLRSTLGQANFPPRHSCQALAGLRFKRQYLACRRCVLRRVDCHSA